MLLFRKRLKNVRGLQEKDATRYFVIGPTDKGRYYENA